MSERRYEKSDFNDALRREQNRLKKENEDLRKKMLSFRLSQQQEKMNYSQSSQRDQYEQRRGQEQYGQRRDFKEVSGLMGHRIDLQQQNTHNVDIRDINGQPINPNDKKPDNNKRLRPYDPNESIIEGFEPNQNVINPTSRVLKQEDY